MKYKNGVIITSVVLSTIIAVTSAGYTLNKKEMDNNNISTSIAMQTTQIDVSNNNIVKDDESAEQEVLQNFSLEELIKQLETTYGKFDKQTQMSLKKLVETVYKNGNRLTEILNQISDFEVSNFILKNIIHPLQHINNIEIVSHDDYDRLNELGYTTCYDEGKNEIRVCNETETLNYQRLLEELMHVNQTDILAEVETGKEFDYADYCILAEGEANVLSWALTYDAICNDSVCIMYSDDTYSDENIIYGTGYSYSAVTKYYMYLVTLIGYDTLQEARKLHDTTVITDALSKTYNIDGREFYNNMKDIIIDLMSNIDNQRTHMLAPIENTYFNCLEQKLEKITDAKELINFFDLYRYMNIQYGFIHNEFDENSNAVDKTDKLVDKSIENMLFEKLEEYSILDKFVDESVSRRKIFNAIINPVRNEEKAIYPISLSNVSISYDQNSNNIVLGFNNNLVITNIDSRKSVLKQGIVNEEGINLFDINTERVI